MVAFFVVPFYCAVELFEDFVEEGDACYYALGDVSREYLNGFVEANDIIKDWYWNCQ